MSDYMNLLKGKAFWNDYVKTASSRPDLSGSNLSDLDLQGCQFDNCDMTGTQFGRCKLDGCSFNRANLPRANMKHVKGLGADSLGNSDLAGATLPDEKLFDPLMEGFDKCQSHIKVHIATLSLIFFAIIAFIFDVNTLTSARVLAERGFANSVVEIIRIPGFLGRPTFVFVLIFLVLQVTSSCLLLHFFIRKAWSIWNGLPNTFPDGLTREQKLNVGPWINLIRLCEPENFSVDWKIWQPFVNNEENLKRLLSDMAGLPLLAMPLVILCAFMIASLQLHNIWLTSLMVLCTSWTCLSMFFLIRVRITSILWFISLSVVVVCILCLVIDLIIVIFFKMHSSNLEIISLAVDFLYMFLLLILGPIAMFVIFLIEFNIVKKRKLIESEGHRWLYFFAFPLLITILVSLVIQGYAFEKWSKEWLILQAEFSYQNLARESIVADEGNKKEYIPALFRGAHLNGARFVGTQVPMGDFTGAKLKYANFSRADLKRAIFLNADLDEANLQGTELNGADLTGASLKGAKLNDADFTCADLTKTKFQGAIDSQDAKFKNVTINLADFTGLTITELTVKGDLQGVIFDETTLRLANFSGKKISNSSFANSHLNEADFTNVRFENVGMVNADLGMSYFNCIQGFFEESILANDMFTGWKFREAMVFKGTILSRVTFENMVMKKVVFEGCEFDQTLLVASDLRGATFIGTQSLSGLSFENCILNEAIFLKVDLSGSNFYLSNLTGAKFKGATGYDNPSNPMQIRGALIKDIEADRAFIEWACQNGAVETVEEWVGEVNKVRLTELGNLYLADENELEERLKAIPNPCENLPPEPEDNPCKEYE